MPPDEASRRGNAEEKQAEALVSLADAVVVLWDGTGARSGILARAQAEGIPVRVLGKVERRGKSVELPEPPHALPD